MSYIGTLKTLFKSTKSKDIIKFINTFDKKKKIRGALSALKPFHIKIALSSVFMDTALPLVQKLCELFKNHAAIHDLQKEMLKAMKEFGPGFVASVKNTKKEHFTMFLAADAKTQNDDEDWITLPDPEGDSLLTPKELKAKQAKLALRDLKLQNRLEIFAQYSQRFYDIFKDPEINKKLKDYDDDLFMDSENWLKMTFFHPELEEMMPVFDTIYFEDGDQKDVAEAYLHLLCMDTIDEEEHVKKLEAKKCRGEDVKSIAPFTPFKEKFWKELNNLELLSKTLSEVSDKNLQELLNFALKLYDDFMAGMIEDVKLLPKMVIQQVQTTTKFDANSARGIGDFILEAVFHNVSQFNQAYQSIKALIPAEAIDFAKDIGKSYGYEISEDGLDTKLADGIKKLVELRNNKQNGQDIVAPVFSFFQNHADNLAKKAESEDAKGEDK